MSSPLLLKELLRTEVERQQQIACIEELLQRGVGIEMLLHSVDQQVDQALLFQEGPEEFVLRKRALLEAQRWLELMQSVYIEKQPLPALYQETVRKLGDLLQSTEAYLPQALSFRKRERPEDFRISTEAAFQKLSSRLKRSSFASQEEVAAFLTERGKELEALARLMNQGIDHLEGEVLKEACGFYIQVPGFFPLIYTVKGSLYVVMEVMGAYLGMGSGKITSYTLDLSRGELLVLVRPRTLFKKEGIETFAFWSTWRETEALFKLQGQRGILQMRERLVFEREGKRELFVFEELYPDGTLERAQNLSVMQKVQIARDLLEGLNALHEKRLIHHDIKPDNIFLSLLPGQEQGVIADFNNVCSSDETRQKDVSRAAPRYCCPEYARVLLKRGARPEEFHPVATFKMDVWALGLVLYHLFNEVTLPWETLTEEAALQKISTLQEGWVPHHEKGERFYPLLEKMLELKVEERCTALEALVLFEQLGEE